MRDIRLTQDLPPRVAVIVDLEPEDAGAQRHDRASLVGSLVTGIKFIQLPGGTEAAGRCRPAARSRRHAPSLEQFRDRLTEIVDRASASCSAWRSRC